MSCTGRDQGSKKIGKDEEKLRELKKLIQKKTQMDNLGSQ